MSHTTGGTGGIGEATASRLDIYRFIRRKNRSLETMGKRSILAISLAQRRVGEQSLCESGSSKRDVRLFSSFFFFSTSGIALDGSETAMAPLLNDASRHRQRGLVIETDNRWTFQSFDFERSALLFDHSKSTRPRETGRNLRALVRTTLDRAAIFMTFFFGPCLPN